MSREAIEPFVVKHYIGTDRPVIKGNGFDGLEVGIDRDEAQRFVDWVNTALRAALSEPVAAPPADLLAALKRLHDSDPNANKCTEDELVDAANYDGDPVVREQAAAFLQARAAIARHS